jgi:DNA-binding NarL/FixJ family response regulator
MRDIDSGGGDLQTLGRREREVLQLLAEGHRSADIAARLSISVDTVMAHRRNIMRKLGLHTVSALTKFAVREGLTSL